MEEELSGGKDGGWVGRQCHMLISKLISPADPEFALRTPRGSPVGSALSRRFQILYCSSHHLGEGTVFSVRDPQILNHISTCGLSQNFYPAQGTQALPHLCLPWRDHIHLLPQPCPQSCPPCLGLPPESFTSHPVCTACMATTEPHSPTSLGSVQPLTT